MTETQKYTSRDEALFELDVFTEFRATDWNRTVRRAALNDVLAYGTQTGTSRSRNEDRFLISQLRADGAWLTLAAVCDGVGGSKRGDEAAEIALCAIQYSLLSSTRKLPVSTRLEQAIRYADDVVRRVLRGEGSATLSIVVGEPGGQCFMANVGDSRIYEWAPGSRLMQLTVDDTIENELRNMSVHDPSVLDVLGIRGQLSQALGEPGRGAEALSVSVFELGVRRGSGLILGTDGLWKICEPAFGAISVNAENASDVIRKTLAFASWVGAVDNATIIAISDLAIFITKPWSSDRQSFSHMTWTLDGKIVSYNVSFHGLASESPANVRTSRAELETGDEAPARNRPAKRERKKRSSKREAPKKSTANQLHLIEGAPSLEITSDEGDRKDKE